MKYKIFLLTLFIIICILGFYKRLEAIEKDYYITKEPDIALEAPISPVDDSKYDVLYYVAKCESGNRQFNSDGTVLRGVVNPKDVGEYQINEYYHLDTAKKLGINIYTREGNREYAEYLFDTQGLRPWSASKHCWQPLIGRL